MTCLRISALIVPLFSAVLFGCERRVAAPAAEPDWVTSAACAPCHQAAFEAWRGSHHDLAMQEASGQSVLGDFGNVTLGDAASTTTFLRRGDEFIVRTAGADGEMADHVVRYTFGVEPLQQLLVELPGGRLQAISPAWDSRPAEAGGQRWFLLDADEPAPPGDVMHWTGAAARWNSMCAHCHSTNVRKGYDLATQSYATTWSEIDVACEACHGPGSAHVAWADSGADPTSANGLIVDLASDDAVWQMNPQTRIARRSSARASHAELETCAGCHSRRALLSEDPVAGRYHDAHLLALLDEELYHADGQVRDEVYVFGSFLQSRMHRAGVSCGDCHDPHSLALRGNTESVCAQCHAPDRFDQRSHHHHEPGTEAARCVSCHMPATRFMGVDARRDHGFRVPRPDLTVKLGVPNACNACHPDRPAAWAAQVLAGQGSTPREHYGETLQAGRRGSAGATDALLALARDIEAPGIARATALSLLGFANPARVAEAVAHGARDPDPLVRRAAAGAATLLPVASRSAAIEALLEDPVRAVRIEATTALLGSGGASPARARALEEYRQTLQRDADLPSTHVNLGLLYAGRGELDAAETAYRRALAVGPWFLPAYVNLADVLANQGRDDEAEQLLRRGLAREPRSSMLLHALGLTLVRSGRQTEALGALEAAAASAPGQPRFAYVLGVALFSQGQTERAIEILQAAHARFPGDASILLALATMHRDLGHLEVALKHARSLESLADGEPGAGQLREQIERLQAR